MSLRRMTLMLSVAILTLGGVAATASARERGDQVRDQVATTIVRLLPPQPKPARRFGAVPVNSPARQVAVFLDRELVWTGSPDDVQDLFARWESDALDPVPVLPPAPIDPGFREVCVGTFLDGDFGDDGPILVELDCDIADRR